MDATIHTYGGILAGGIGSRMSGAGKPKQFLDVGGVPVLVRAVRRFLELDDLAGVVLAMHPDWRDHSLGVLRTHGIDVSRVEIVSGGPSRFESLVNLANGCSASAARRGAEGRVLMISHDCARPFVSVDILRRNVAALLDGGCDMATTSIPTIDTVLLSSDGNRGDCVPERSTVFLDQGPQTVDVAHFLGLVERLSREERERYIEAGRLYMEKGFNVRIVAGDRGNFKLTTPFDMVLAERLLAEGLIS